MTMPRSPGVYVREVPSAVQPIAGVGTSTAGFIGVFDTPLAEPASGLEDRPDGRRTRFLLSSYPVDPQTLRLTVNEAEVPAVVENNPARRASFLVLARPPAAGAALTATYSVLQKEASDTDLEAVAGSPNRFLLSHYPVDTTQAPTVTATRTIEVAGVKEEKSEKRTTITLKSAPGANSVNVRYTIQELPGEATLPFTRPAETTNPPTVQLNKLDVDDKSIQVTEAITIADARLVNDDRLRESYLELDKLPDDLTDLAVAYRAPLYIAPALPAPGEARLCTSFEDFKRSFGDFSLDPGQRTLAHAVYGFFNNGGTRCYVARVTRNGEVAEALKRFETIDEIAIVAAPGIADGTVWDALTTHCEQMGDRFAIFDGPERLRDDSLELLNAPADGILPPNTTYGAYYFPWLQVYDPLSDGRIYVPPSGHMAGIYARVDTARGVHKAPANEVVLGALGLRYQLSRAQQDGLNPQGVNCIRELNGNIRVWGARTLGGDANGEWKYVNVRRLFLFLRESIDEGTQWAVFEPNDLALWAKITRNITAFLTVVWRAGALFGATPQEAFYVKCDASTNPPELRDLGQVVTEIGVAVTRPAEFVIFNVSQWQGPAQ